MSLLKPLNRLLTAPVRRLCRARPGSVLILVIALLVLLALIGTAYISTTRSERYTSLQNTANTQADLLLDGLVNTVKYNISGELFGLAATGGSAYRPPILQSTVPGLSSGYNNYTSTNTDLFLADRLPESTANNNTWWGGFSWPLLAGSSGDYAFDIVNAASGAPTQIDLGATTKKHDYQAYITWTSLNGQVMPAFQIKDTSPGAVGAPWLTAKGPSNIQGNATIIAGDADGDGIADSGLWKLPVGEISGVSYYAAVRVVDNNSAVNASSANSALVANIGDNATALNAIGAFRSGLGLLEMLNPAPAVGAPQANWELGALNGYRVFNIASNLVLTPSNPGFGYNPAALAPFSDTTNIPTARPDFNFLSLGDALENQLTRRTGFPGYSTAARKFQWLGLPESAALAYHFCLVNPSSAYSTLEQALPNELLIYDYLNKRPTVHTAPYGANEVGGFTTPGTWYGDNFDFAAGTPKPLRAVLTCDNPVANAVPGHYTYRGQYTPGATYHFGDWVYFPSAAGATSGYCFVCIQDHIDSAPNQLTLLTATAMAQATWTQPLVASTAADAFWAFVPWTTTPVKTNANVGTFGQLWAAYWNVMYDHASTVANGFPQPAFGFPRAGDLTATNQSLNQEIIGTSANAARMFRTPIRDPNASGANALSQYLNPGQVMLLRSAMAALNTVSLRAASGTPNPSPTGLDTVISREIQIPADTANDAASKAYRVMLFGATKQPYISDFYVKLDNTGAVDTVVIELSNPYPTAMTLTNWQIARMNRSTTGYSTGAGLAMTVTTAAPLTGVTIPGATAGSPGKLLIWDSTSGQPTFVAVAPGVNVAPQAAGLATATSPAAGMELAILRPRDAAGVLNQANAGAAVTDSVNTYNETVPADLVPVDQIDMTNLVANTEYVYRRASAPAGTAWNFVYPGAYSFLTQPLRQQGLFAVVTPPLPTSFGADKTAFPGAPSGIGSAATYLTFPLQVANTDAAGWNQVTGALQHFPFGGFARNGDLMQVPFIGAYRILPALTVPPALAGTKVVELNSLPMDSAFADDQDALDDPATTDAGGATAPPQMHEQIGRFCQVGTPGTPDFDFLPPSPFVAGSVPSNTNVAWRYHWAKSLLDFVTVQSPDNDYLPNADPLTYPVATPVVPVSNKLQTVTNARAAGTSEDTAPVQGLININTAPFVVLKNLPWFPPGYTDPVNAGITPTSLANAIVAYRDLQTSTPFETVFDLYKVGAFKTAADDYAVYAQSAGNQQTAGDLSPVTAASTDYMKYDFEKRFLLLNRISNLITTRSDSFTCYVLLQGWRGVGTGTPTLVVQRRAAFILDRTTVTPSNVQPNVYRVLAN